MLEAIQEYFFQCMINAITVIYLLTKILNYKLNYSSPKLYIIVLVSIFLSIANFIYIDGFLRLIISTIYTIVYSCILFNDNSHKIAIAVILEQIILVVAELMYALLLIVLTNIDNIAVSETILGGLIPNLIICLIAVSLINFKFAKSFCDKIIDYMNRIKQKNKYVLALFFIITLNVLLMVIYINSNNLVMVIVNVAFILIYSGVVFLLLNEKNENIKFKEENKNLLDNLNEYEKMLDYQRVANHENKNQLLVIKSMINKNNKKLHNYIDEVIKEKREDNETLYTKAKRIPSGGLQGLFYQKMLRMQDENINIDLNISTDIRKIDLSKLDAKMNYDICRALGVIIDNAVEETIKIDDKEISISMYKDDNDFVIEVANKCMELPELDKIDEKGYTTKEKGHGYGLSLLKDICKNNKDIKNERRIVGNIFFQIIKIKM